MTEQWKPVVGYEGSYEVSNQYLHLSRNAETCGAYVHTLVLTAFKGSRPIGQEACHNDGDPANNRADNLRWDSKSSNVRDRVRHGTHSESRKTTCPRGHALAEPNLMPSATRRGHRSCLACNRAHAASEPFTKELADSYYERILAEASL